MRNRQWQADPDETRELLVDLPLGDELVECRVRLGAPRASVHGLGMVLDLGMAWVPVLSVIEPRGVEVRDELRADALDRLAMLLIVEQLVELTEVAQ